MNTKTLNATTIFNFKLKIFKNFALLNLLFSLLFLMGCDPHQKSPTEPVKKNQNSHTKNENKEKSLAELLSSPESCRSVSGFSQKPPLWVKDSHFVITRILKDCVTSDGFKGYEVDSPWVAMGFPCTGGGGKIQSVENFKTPKFVSFIFSTGCPMLPADQKTVQDAGVQFLNLENQAKLLAFSPFAVQYWELPEIEEADVGFLVNLRSNRGLKSYWTDFIAGKPIAVHLYGRENSWSHENHFYQVKARIVFSGDKMFQLQVDDVKSLDENELKAVQLKCEELRPRRNCQAVF